MVEYKKNRRGQALAASENTTFLCRLFLYICYTEFVLCAVVLPSSWRLRMRRGPEFFVQVFGGDFRSGVTGR